MPTFDTLVYTPNAGGGTTTVDLKLLLPSFAEEEAARLSVQDIPGGDVHYVSVGGPSLPTIRCAVRFYTYAEYIYVRDNWVGTVSGTLVLNYAEGAKDVCVSRLVRTFRKGDLVLANAEFLVVS